MDSISLLENESKQHLKRLVCQRKKYQEEHQLWYIHMILKWYLK